LATLTSGTVVSFDIIKRKGVCCEGSVWYDHQGVGLVGFVGFV
jgi:hypothetical protein